MSSRSNRSRSEILVHAEGSAADASSIGDTIITHDSRWAGHDDLIAEVDAILRPSGLVLAEDEDGDLVVDRLVAYAGAE